MSDVSVIESIFLAALGRPTPRDRADYLDAACSDLETRRQVQRLLDAHPDLGSFLAEAESRAGALTAEPAPLSEQPGVMVGPYKLLQLLGEGGMGVVYMAEQEKPVRRRVALKIIKPGMDSKQVIARFEAERQALALMDHPNIARVFEAGTTASGRPYFVMELVHGIPITKFCDENMLTPRERLELFVPVCQAIQHAHQKGIIHRDIKPSNVLVTLYDDRPVPKVIDFGVAKAVEQRLTDRTLFTHFGAMVGTFEYMSPEQAEMNALGVDTRSDIYSLGVLLYELLTGTTPLEAQRLRQAALGELVRLIKEEEPPRPSVRLSGSGDLPRIAAARKTEPARLSKLVRGEVDWIVMKCLEKDRVRRYETALGLARDLERHLHDEPVEACPPSAWYRMKKVARRHRISFSAAASFVLLLVGAAVVAGMLALAANRAAMQARRLHLEAVESRLAAEEQRTLSEERRRESDDARRTIERSLYASEMQLAEQAWEVGDIPRMRELLDANRHRPGTADPRGFEWHYLRGLGTDMDVVRLTDDATSGGLSPDGTRFAYLGTLVRPQGPDPGLKRRMYLLDVGSGRPAREVVPFPGEPMSDAIFRCTFSPDGKRLVMTAMVVLGPTSYAWRMKVFDWETGRAVCPLADIGGAPGAAAFDPSGNRLAVISVREGDGPAGSDLRLWNLPGEKPVRTIPLPGREVLHLGIGLAFHPDGTRVAALTRPTGNVAVGTPGEVRVWDAGSGKESLRFDSGPGSCGVLFSPDGKWLAEIGSGGTSHRLRDAGSGRQVLELTTAPTTGLTAAAAFSRDGSRLAVGSQDSRVRIWSAGVVEPGGARGPERMLEGKALLVNQVAWSADGGRLMASSSNGTVLSWPVRGRAPGVVVTGPERTYHVTANAAVKALRFAAAFEAPHSPGVVKVWDDRGQILFSVDAGHPVEFSQATMPRMVELNRDGRRLAYHFWDVDPALGKPNAMGRLIVWDIATGREVFRHDDENASLLDAALSPDGRVLATSWNLWNDSAPPRTHWDHWVAIWDLETGRQRLRLEVPEPAGLAFSPDGRRLAAGLSPMWSGSTGGGELRVWDAATGEVTFSRKYPHAIVDDPTYSHDGELLALVVGDRGEAGVIKVLGAAKGDDRLTLAGHHAMVWKLAFNPDGTRLASVASFPMQPVEVKLWDLAGGREVLALEADGVDRVGSHRPGNSGFSFSPDGNRLFYLPGGGRREAELQVWDGTPGVEGGSVGAGGRLMSKP